MFLTTIHEIHTTERVKSQQAAKNTVSANGFKWFDITFVADKKTPKKPNLLQYHENTRVITGAKTNHEPGHIKIKFYISNIQAI